MKSASLIVSVCFLAVWAQASFRLNPDKASTKFLLNSFLTKDDESTSKSLYEDNNFNVDDGTDGDDDYDNSDYHASIMSLNYNGYWNAYAANDNSESFTFLSKSSGLAQFTAARNYYLGIDDFIIFTFYDGEYTDKKYAVVNFIYDNKTDFDPANSTFKNDNMTFFVYMFDEFSEQGQLMCEGSYKLSFIDNSTNQPYQKASNDYTNVYAKFQINSTDCGIAISSIVSVRSEVQQSELIAYMIMTSVICVFHLWGSAVISKNIIQSEPEGARISMITLGYFIGWDVFLCLFHLYSALTVDDYFRYFLPPAFLYFVLVSIFETRLILLVWKSKYYGQYQNITEVRRGIVRFYLTFYGFLTGFLLLCYFFLPATWLFYALCLYFIPQIIHNAMRGQKYIFNKSFVFTLGLLRIVLPLYVKGYSRNIFLITPDTDFVFIFSGVVLAQIFILFLQSKLGSRFFIPACLLPPRYNYYVKVSEDLSTDEESTGESCPICMEGLNQNPVDVKTPLVKIKYSKKLRLMQTPCKHQFHEQCLKGWMDLKLECPSCRTILPPVD